MSDSLGLGGGRGLGGVEFGFFRKLRRSVSQAARGVVRGASAAGRGVVRGAAGAGKGLVKVGKGAGKGLVKVGKGAGRLVSYAAPVLELAGGAAAAASCASLGVPPALCAKGGAALGRAIGKQVSGRLGLPVRELPVDPRALVSGDPVALMTLGRTLAERAGMPLPSPEAAIALAVKRAGLPPEVVAVAKMARAVQVQSKPAASKTIGFGWRST